MDVRGFREFVRFTSNRDVPQDRYIDKVVPKLKLRLVIDYIWWSMQLSSPSIQMLHFVKKNIIFE